LTQLSQRWQQQDRPEYQSGAIDNEKSSRPQTGRDMRQPCQLIGV
jgi:hypothetical protein